MWPAFRERRDTLPAGSGDAINCTCIGDKLTVTKVPACYRDKEQQDETPRQFETPGHSAKLCACAHSESSGQDADMAAASRKRPTDTNVDVICVFNRGNQNRPKRRPGLGFAHCHFDSKIWRPYFRRNDAHNISKQTTG